MALRFSKYEGTANDFVLVETCAIDAGPLEEHEVRAICDRHRGVGADGVLLVDVDAEVPSMRVMNADGSVPEMCGNGLRCVARHLQRIGRAGDEVVVDTDAGPHLCRFVGDDVEIEMRVPSLAAADVPIAADAPWIDADFDVDGRTLHVTAVSMGNPHAVFFDDLAAERAELGPRIGVDPRFPRGANVGFARWDGEGLELFVHERGAGFTQACGTGACAAAVAAVETGRATRNAALRVRVPGGTLFVTVREPGERVLLRGPARFVFDGRLDRASIRGVA